MNGAGCELSDEYDDFDQEIASLYCRPDGEDTIVGQTVKTLRRPQRVLNAPLIISRQFLNLVDHTTAERLFCAYSRVPTYLRWGAADKFFASASFYEGTKLLDENNPQAAWRSLEFCLANSNNPDHYFVAAVCLLVGMGQVQNAMALFTRANELRRERAKAFGVENSRIRFLEPIWAGSFGHIAQTDYLLKLSMLEGRSPSETIIYLPTGSKIANQYLFDQWRPYYSVVEDIKNLPLPLEAIKSLSFDFLAPRLADGRTIPLWTIAADTYRRWYNENRGPLLTISSDLENRALSGLCGVGFPRDAWFIALHVRESTSIRYHSLLHDSLNADIIDYMPAVNEIVRRGGWVVRLGDPTMKKLPPMQNVLDYCHSDIRSDWMDIYLLAKCRFLLGTSSGPAYIPPIFGTPCVLTNWWPPAQKPWHPQDIFVPKRIRINQQHRLTLAQSLDEPFGYCNSKPYLKQKNAIIEGNTPDDIFSAVTEMLDRLDGATYYSEQDIRRRNNADRIYESFGIRGMAQISRDFLRNNRDFLE